MKTMLLFALSAVLFAQVEKPAFEVATVKPHDPNSGVVSGTSLTPVRYAGVGSLRSLIQTAYEVQDYQVSGGPAWVNTDLYEVDGRAASPTARNQMMLMLKALLAERFKLAMHRDSKEVPIYALTVAKDGPSPTKTDLVA